MTVLKLPQTAVHNQVFNVGNSDENYQISQLADFVADIVPGCRIDYSPGGGPDKRCYKVSCDKLFSMVPAYATLWTVRKSIQDLLRHYRVLGLKEGEFEGPRYSRISHLKDLMESGQLDNTLRWIK